MRLAAYQFAVCGDIDHNLEIIKKAIVSASENKVEYTSEKKKDNKCH